MAIVRSRSIPCFALTALLLTSCGVTRDILGIEAPERSIVASPRVYEDGAAVGMVLVPLVQASVSFEITHNVPPGYQIQVLIRSHNDRETLLEVISGDDGTLPEAESLIVPRKLPFRIVVGYRESRNDTWSKMKVNCPIQREEWDRFMPAGAWDSEMIQWAMPGAQGKPDPMVGYVGVTLQVTDLE